MVGSAEAGVLRVGGAFVVGVGAGVGDGDAKAGKARQLGGRCGAAIR